MAAPVRGENASEKTLRPRARELTAEERRRAKAVIVRVKRLREQEQQQKTRRAADAERRRDQEELRQHGFVGASERSNRREVRAAMKLAPVRGEDASEKTLRPREVRQKRYRDYAKTAPKANLAERFADDLIDIALNTPGGVYEVGKAAAGDVNALRNPMNLRHPGRMTLPRLRKIGKAMVESTWEDLQHPVRHPGYTALDLLALASVGGGGVVRASAATRAVRAGEGVRRAVTRSSREGGGLIHAPLPGRIVVDKELGLEVPAFRNPAARAVQKGYHRVVHGAGKTGKALAAERRVTEAAERAPAAALVRRGKRLSTPQQTALRVVAEGKTVADRIAAHERDWDAAPKGAKGQRIRSNLRRKILLLKAAERYVDDSSGKPRLRDDFKRTVRDRVRGVDAAALKAAYEKTGASAGRREAILEDAGLGDAVSAERPHQPGRVIEGTALRPEPGPEPPTPGQLSFVEEPDMPLFEGGEFRVGGYGSEARKAIGPVGGYRGGNPRKPGSTTHDYTGEAQRQGDFRDTTTRVVAEDELEAQRYGSLIRLRDRIRGAARDEPGKKGKWVPIRLDKLNRGQSADLRRILAKQEEGVKLTRSEREVIGSQYDAFRADVFPDGPVEGVKWVPERLLDGLNHRTGAVINPKARAAVATLDTINDLARAAILYAKPAYAIPNVIGNAAMNVVQQGVKAPVNWTRQASIRNNLGEEAAAVLDGVVGEGFVRAMAADSRGVAEIRALVQAAAATWSRAVDAPFRRASFIHEARKLGYRTPDELRDLLLNPEKHPDLIEAAIRANRAIVDFSRLGPNEKAIIRRALFVYPWLKGSTMYAGHFAVEHPVQATVAGQLSRQGEAKAQEDLGPLPSFMQGTFKVADRAVGVPLTVNPAGVSTLATPAQLAKVARSFLEGGKRKKGEQIVDLLSPGLAAVGEAATGRDFFTGRELTGSGPRIFLDSLTGGLPQALLKKRLDQAGEDQSERLYPLTTGDAWRQFVFGSGYPKPVNLDVASRMADDETMASLGKPERATRRVFNERRRFLDAAQTVAPGTLENGRLPAKLRAAFNIEAERQRAYAKASDGLREGTRDYHFARYVADLRLLVRHGVVPNDRANTVIRQAKNADMEELKAARRGISEQYYQAEGGQLYYIGHARKVLKERGAKDLG